MCVYIGSERGERGRERTWGLGEVEELKLGWVGELSELEAEESDGGEDEDGTVAIEEIGRA